MGCRFLAEPYLENTGTHIREQFTRYDDRSKIKFRAIFNCMFSSASLFHCLYAHYMSFNGFGLVCWPLVPKFAGSNPTEADGFLGRKNPQHAFLRRGSKAVGPMS